MVGVDVGREDEEVEIVIGPTFHGRCSRYPWVVFCVGKRPPAQHWFIPFSAPQQNSAPSSKIAQSFKTSWSSASRTVSLDGWHVLPSGDGLTGAVTDMFRTVTSPIRTVGPFLYCTSADLKPSILAETESVSNASVVDAAAVRYCLSVRRVTRTIVFFNRIVPEVTHSRINRR